MSRNFRIRPRPGPRAWQNSPGLAHRQGVLTVARERVSGPEMGSNFGQGWKVAPSSTVGWAVLGRSTPPASVTHSQAAGGSLAVVLTQATARGLY